MQVLYFKITEALPGKSSDMSHRLSLNLLQLGQSATFSLLLILQRDLEYHPIEGRWQGI
jgi:hypothetical protein